MEEDQKLWDDAYEGYCQWISKVKKKSIADYKEFRRHSEMPYAYIREELSCMDEVISIGFISTFIPLTRYGKEVFQIKDEECSKLLEGLGDLQNIEWFQHAYFEKQWNAFDLPIPKGYSEDEWDPQIYEWDEYIAQRSDYWGYSYFGYIALPMTNGRFWLLYYKC